MQVAVVGGGYSGLSAAYHLKIQDPDLDVVLLEAQRVGGGASGANSGQCAPRVGDHIERQVAAYGERTAARVYQVTLDAVETVRRLIAARGIDCNVTYTGQVHAAVTRNQARALQHRAELYGRLGFDVPYLDAAEIRRVINTDLYRGGLRYDTAFCLDPARLCQGLKECVLDHGVRIYESTPVTRYEPGTPVRLFAGGYSVVADHVVLATDGYAPKMSLLGGQVIPIVTKAIATRPLSETERTSLGWDREEGVYDARRVFNFFRMTHDRRILFGGDYRYLRSAPAACGNGLDLQAQLTGVFPQLRGIAVTHQWSGILGCTLDLLPIIRFIDVHRRMLFVGAWNGHGVALATASGELVATLLHSRPRAMPELPWVREKSPRVPQGALAALVFGWYFSALRLLDRISLIWDRGRTLAERLAARLGWLRSASLEPEAWTNRSREK